MPVTRPLLNFATSCCGEIFSSWASEQLPRQRRALILISRVKQICFARMHSTEYDPRVGSQLVHDDLVLGVFFAPANTADTADPAPRLYVLVVIQRTLPPPQPPLHSAVRPFDSRSPVGTCGRPRRRHMTGGAPVAAPHPHERRGAYMTCWMGVR